MDAIASLLGRGLQRPNRFSVSGFPGGGLVDQLCCAAPSPGSSYSTFIWKNAGPGIPLPYETITDQFRFEFWDDDAKTVSNALFGWHRSVVNENFKFNFLADYARDITINEMDCNNSITQSRKLLNAWCVTYDTIELSHEQTNQLKKISIGVVCERIE